MRASAVTTRPAASRVAAIPAPAASTTGAGTSGTTKAGSAMTALTNTAVAARLGLAAKTVANHLSAIFTKLQVAGRAEAIAVARQGGLGSPRAQR